MKHFPWKWYILRLLEFSCVEVLCSISYTILSNSSVHVSSYHIYLSLFIVYTLLEHVRIFAYYVHVRLNNFFCLRIEIILLNYGNVYISSFFVCMCVFFYFYFLSFASLYYESSNWISYVLPCELCKCQIYLMI